jgi:hypothetical protein
MDDELSFRDENYVLCVDVVSSDIWSSIERNATMQHQSQGGTRRGLEWFRSSQRVIAIRLELLYYAVEKLVAPAELWAATYVV